ncbi:S9 family peptidase [Pontibacter sp. KCTC 32443]|uniref:prolyl oligopeptidase family serine peptidase n=1 Tax=Pontibacter TaxID=323449 RepID=UPI00164DB0E5|nr:MULTISPECIES: prolyl oligopeptidase family serine peptidase [Pontibacter]MBC5775247.1 S9 family peptidase [Pontibacter sp. KCTC 32443]
MKHILLLLSLCLQTSLLLAQQLEYPTTTKVAVTDTFYNQHIVRDEYRWLEAQNSPEVTKWVDEQNKLSKKHLVKASNQTNAFLAIDKYSYVSVSQNYTKVGNYYFRYYYYNNNGTPALYYKSEMSDKPEQDDLHPLVDPLHISAKDKITLRGFDVSKNSELLAYQFSRNGSDWAEIKVVELKGAIHRKDHLKDVKFSSISWKGNGFFYAAYPNGGNQKIFYHQMGTDQSDDKVIYESANPATTLDFLTTIDERYFVLTVRNEKNGSKTFYYIDYDEQEQSQLKPLLANIRFGLDILGTHNGKFIAQTNHNANFHRLIEIDPANPTNWKVIVPEFEKTAMLETFLSKDRIIVTYLTKGHPLLTVFDYTGKLLYKLDLPVATTIGNFTGSPDDEEILYRYSSFTFPTIVYKFNVKTFERKLTERTTVTYDLDKFEYKYVEYPAKDGTLIPMTLVYEKGLKLNGKNPTLLKTYGGFGAISEPGYSPGLIHFIKNGGVFAFASVRGGGELGSKWAMEGRGKYKQNTFDDFIAGAEYLISSGYTSPEKLATTGASNGGLVVATAAIQRPDLFKAVVPVVAPLDMLRFEKFTIGVFHTDEYGTVTNNEGFKSLINYSPLHNIKDNVNYPAMLIMTSDTDDRVPPLHSFKFAAKLQNSKAQTNPVLLRVEGQAGHYGANGIYSNVREEADIYAFIMQQLSNSK